MSTCEWGRDFQESFQKARASPWYSGTMTKAKNLLVASLQICVYSSLFFLSPSYWSLMLLLQSDILGGTMLRQFLRKLVRHIGLPVLHLPTYWIYRFPCVTPTHKHTSLLYLATACVIPRHCTHGPPHVTPRHCIHRPACVAPFRNEVWG